MLQQALTLQLGYNATLVALGRLLEAGREIRGQLQKIGLLRQSGHGDGTQRPGGRHVHVRRR